MGLQFPASEIHEFKDSFDEHTEREKLEMFVNFMGMVGVSGVMPVHYTELIMDRVRYRDTAMWMFMDIFTHRSVSMFFRAWEKYRFPVDYERGQDNFTAYLFDFAGLGTSGLRGRMHLDDESLLPYGGLIAQKPHSAIMRPIIHCARPHPGQRLVSPARYTTASPRLRANHARYSTGRS